MNKFAAEAWAPDAEQSACRLGGLSGNLDQYGHAPNAVRGQGGSAPLQLSDYQILLINNGLMFSPYMTQKAAHKHITSHPKFAYKDAAL